MATRATETVSIVIPTLREDEIGRALERLIEHLRGVPGYAFDVVVVDDSDGEAQARVAAEIERLRALGSGVALRLVPGPRRGKGAAVRAGAMLAAGSIVFTLDADLPVLLSHVEDFLGVMRTGADVVVGERARDRYAGDAVRDAIARALRLIQQALVFHGPAFEDTQCGFKAYRAPALRAIAERQTIDGGMYDLEYLYAATLRRLDVRRVPVTSSPQVRPSRIRVLRCVILDPFDIVRLKVAGLLGRYA